MKKSILGMIASASMAMASCTQEVELLTMDDMENVEFTGTIEDVNTRTSMDNTGKVIWCANDPISIFMRNGHHYKYQSNSGGSDQTTFAYADWYSEGSNTLDKNYAVYPFAEGNTFDATTKKFTVDLSRLASQIYTEGSFEEGQSVMTAKSEGKSLPFYNALSMLKVSLKSQVPHAYRINKIEIESGSLFLNSQSATIDMSQDGSATVLASGNKVNTLDCPGGVVLSTEYTDFYILVPANEVPAGDFTIKITYIDEFTGIEDSRKETINKAFRFVRSKWVEYKRDFDDEEWDGTIIPNTAITTAAELQKALDEATDGTTLVLADDITGDVTVTQKPDVKITIDGKGFNFAGVITVDGKSATYTTAGLTIKDLKFNATSISADACINLGKKGDNNTRYTCNVTVEDCTFDVPEAVGIKSYTGGDKNLTITRCTATTNAHSLLQAKGIDPILVEECSVYSKNGLNFNNSTNVTVDQCTVNVKGYATRFGEGSSGTGAAEVYSISNSSLQTDNSEGDAVIVLRGTADNSTLTIVNTTISGNLKIQNTATGAKVTIDGATQESASTQDGLNEAVSSNSNVNINLGNGNYTMPSANNGNVTISGTKDAVITITTPNYTGSDVTLNGVTVKGSGYATGIQHVNTVTYNDVTIEGEMCLYGEKVVFKDCDFELGSNQYIWTYGAKEVEFIGCTFNTAGKAILIYNEGAGASRVTVRGCTFHATAGAKASAIANQNCAAIEIDNFQDNLPGVSHTLVTSQNNYDNNNNTFSGEWRIKKYQPGGTIKVNEVEYTSLAIDGKTMTIDENKNVTVNP